MNFINVFILLTALLPSLALAESASVSLASSRSLQQAAKMRAETCEKVKANPNCQGREALLQATVGLNVASCASQQKTLSCEKLFDRFPQYKAQAMKCEPYEVCKLSLESTLAEGCKRYGIEIKEGFVAMIAGEAQCATQWQCLAKRSLTAFEIMIMPSRYLARKGQEMATSTIQSFKDDRAKLERMACLNPETQAQVQCYLAVKYGGMVLGASAAARTVGSSFMARMAVMERNLASTEFKVASRTPAKVEKAFIAAPAEVNELRAYIRDLYPNQYKLDVVDGRGILTVKYMSLDDAKLLSLMTKAVRSGGLSTINAGEVVGPKVFNVLTRMESLAPANAPLRIHGTTNIAEVVSVKNAEVARSRRPDNPIKTPGFNWSERDIANYEAAMKKLKVAEACQRIYKTTIDKCGDLTFTLDARNPSGVQWRRRD